jgi:hypothetical protein
VGVTVLLVVGPSTALASSGWSAPVAVDPAFAATSVSCPSRSFCAAVASDGRAMSAITFNGSSWSRPANIYNNHATCTPASACAYSSLSCVSTSFCMAVDAYGNAVSFNGSSWSAPAAIAGASTNELTQVSCAAPSFCVAVGGLFSPSSGASGDAATFNGSSWSAPAKIDGAWLESVSCALASFCVAVDGSGNALIFNGSSWSAPTKIDGNNALRSVSCPSASYCMVVDDSGNYLEFNGSLWNAPTRVDSRALTSVSCPSASFCAVVDGGGWALTSTIAPANIDGANSLGSVSCASESFCVAVDHDGRFFTFNGNSWAAAVMPVGGDDFVSCASASFCVAVDRVGQALRFNGTSWSAPTTIDATSSLTSVSCPSASFCAAVDKDGRALTFNGSSWSAPNSIDHAYPLVSVSCVSAAFCAAVDSGTGAFIYNGSSWSSASPDSGLRSVACASPSFCVAVSYYGRATTFNGSSWSAPVLIDGNTDPVTGVTYYNVLSSVSCPSASFCGAGDQSGNALTFNGSSWRITGHAGLLTSVSCPSASFCAAVDYGGNALTFNGSSWSAPANIDGTSQLKSVSCASASFCVAMDVDGNALILGGGGSSSGGVGGTGGSGGSGGGGSGGAGGGGSGGARPPVARVLGGVSTSGAALKFRFACQGTAGQSCRGAASVTTIEKLSANGKRITGVLASARRSGRTKLVVVAKANLSTRAGRTSAVSISLNATGRMLRSRFKKLPASVQVTATAGGRTTTIKTAKVTFGPDPPRAIIAGSPATQGTKLTFRLACRGIAGQRCAGTANLTTFEKLSADGRTITGLAYGRSGHGKLEMIATARYSAKAGSTIKVKIKLNATGKRLLAKFGRIPATLKVTLTYHANTTTAATANISFKR